jgi:hypothetical protein
MLKIRLTLQKQKMRKLLLLLFLLPFCIYAQSPAENNPITASDSFPSKSLPGSEESKKDAKEKLEGIRQKVLKGELSFAAAATLYTDDPGSAKTGGLYMNMARGQFVPEFDALAFSLQPGEISEVFETRYGFHFLQVVARHGELADVRHILVKPK